MAEVSLTDFLKLDLRVGQVITAEKLDWSEKLLKLEVDFGNFSLSTGGQGGKKQVLTGIANWYKPEDLIGIQAIFLVNLPIKTIENEKSEAMILTAEDDLGNVYIITPQKSTKNGAKIS